MRLVSPTPPPGASPPDAEALQQLERQARTRGSGVGAGALPGRWRLQRVWPRRGGPPQATASALLRALDACLEIGEPGPDGTLPLRNSVALGPLELRFAGEGQLTGRRPLLRFWFQRWQLQLAGRPWLGGALARPAERSLPFFALIGLGRAAGDGAAAAGGVEGSDWLAARGRGGGLALWERRAGERP